MSEPGWAAWLGERHVTESPAQKMSRQAWQAAARQERAEAAREAEEAAEREEEHDARAMRFAAAGLTGHSLGDVFARAAAIGDEDSEYEAARALMEKIEKRRERRAAMAEDQLAAVQRSVPPGDPLEEASRRAHRAFRQHTSAMLTAAAVAPRNERRPFSGGAAVRSEYCVYCTADNVSDEESYLLHSDPEFGLPVTSAEQAEQAGHPYQAEDAGRYQPFSQHLGPQIARVVTPAGNVAL